MKEKTMAVFVSVSLFACLIYGASIVEKSRHHMGATKTIQANTISSDIKAMPSLALEEAIAAQ